MDTFSYVALAVFAAVLIVVNVVLMPRIRKNMNKTKNNVKNSAAKAAATDTTDDGEYVLETPSLVEDVMTTQEKQAYHYFIDDENSDADKKKGGCLNKSGGKSTITDEEYDQIVTDKLNDFGNKARALNKIGIDETWSVAFVGMQRYLAVLQ